MYEYKVSVFSGLPNIGKSELYRVIVVESEDLITLEEIHQLARAKMDRYPRSHYMKVELLPRYIDNRDFYENEEKLAILSDLNLLMVDIWTRKLNVQKICKEHNISFPSFADLDWCVEQIQQLLNTHQK